MNHYTVLVVGARGSGKTVFLGSMYKKLSVAGEHSFFLEANGDQQQKLFSLYRSVATGKEWPDATQMSQIDEWEFSCRVVAPSGKIYTAFRITYLDYSGGRITRAHENSEEFINRIKNADCLLGLIDGERLLDFMNGIDDDGAFEHEALQNTLTFLGRNEYPVHLVISKWDLFDNQFDLEEVRSKLFEIPEFKNLVATKEKSKSPIRLIPVSSVGSGFAARESNGIMKKMPGKRPSPFQVEMPLALALPDKMRMEFARIAQEEEKKRAVTITLAPNLSFWDRLKATMGGGVRLVREYLPSRYHFSEKILEKMAEKLEESARYKTAAATRLKRDREKEINLSLSQVIDEKTALEHALESFLDIEADLDAAYPASRLRLPVKRTF